MREISPSVNLSVEEYLARFPLARPIVKKIRDEKKAGQRLKPSSTLIDKSSLMTQKQRSALLDKVAELVDENLTGRSDMCVHSAQLLHKALAHLGFSSRPVFGSASYFDEKGRTVFTWEHAWVRIGNEVLDGNVDSIIENPVVPTGLNIPPYWGPIAETPKDRKLFQGQRLAMPNADDVEKVWWPELEAWLKSEMTL